MALDGAAFSPKEFGLAIQAETATLGTKKTDGMTRVNVDSVEMPAFNLTQVMDARSGSAGRVADGDDVFIDQKGVTKEISFSGVLDTTVAALLIQNCIAKEDSSNIVSIAYDYAPPELETGDTSSLTIADTITIAVLNPSTGSNHNMILPGCVITSLTISGDMGDESGRLKFSATARSGYIAEFNQAAPTVSAYGTTFYSLATLSSGDAKKIAGCDDPVVQSFSLTVENPAEFVGQNDANGNPDAIVRAVPEISVNLDATVKYDANTGTLMNTMNTGANAAFYMGTHATIGDSSTTFAFESANARITSLSYNEANAMMIDVSTKAVTTSSGNLFQIHY